MTDQEKTDVQALLDALPRCERYIGPERCREIATMLHPTAVIGDAALRCSEHLGAPANDFGDTAEPTRWASAVACLVAQGFRSRR